MLKPGSFALTALLGLLIALGPLSTDMYLPSLPAIGRALGADTPAVQATLSFFLLGFALGQLVYGPVADRRGRKPVLIAGLLVYVAASALCAAAWSIETLMAARFLQAFGASGPIVLARAVVRDLYDGDRAGQELSRMGSLMGLVPAVAPSIGAGLEVLFGWRANFAASAGFGLVALGLVALRLPETLKAPDPTPLRAGAVAGGFAGLLRERHFRLYALLLSATYCGLFAFISGSSFVLQNHYGMSELAFGAAFGACALAYVAGTVLGRGLVPRRGMNGAIAAGAMLLALGGGAMVAGQLAGAHHPLEIVLPMMVYMVGVGFAFPLTQAAALIPYPDRAGAASSLLGFVQMTTGAAVGVAVGAGVGRTPWALVAAVALLGFAALGIERAIAAARRT